MLNIRMIRFGLLSIISVIAADCVFAGSNDANCCRPATASATPERDRTAAAPYLQPPYQQPAAPTLFAAPTPTGEISGSRIGISLPSLRMSLPRLTLETPELSIVGFGRSRRDPQMRIDATTAAASAHNPLYFGQIPQELSRGPAPAAPAAPAPAAAAPAEGCVSLESQREHLLAMQVQELQKLLAAQQAGSGATEPDLGFSRDPWASIESSQYKQCEQQVASLATDLNQLQTAVQRLVELRSGEAAAQNSMTQVQRMPSDQQSPPAAPDAPVSQFSSQQIIEEQADRIARLEARLNQLTASPAASHVTPASHSRSVSPTQGQQAAPESTQMNQAPTEKNDLRHRFGKLFSRR